MARNRYLSYWKKFFQAHTQEVLCYLEKINSPHFLEVKNGLESDYNSALERYNYTTGKVREWKSEIRDLPMAVEMFQSAKDDFQNSLRLSIDKWKFYLKIQ